jgi:phospholipid/cholesterol/gamma-HCH transport system substrate-binding protein
MSDVRDHLTERINRARLKLEVKRALRPLVVVAVGAALGLAFLLIQVNEIAKDTIQGSRELRFAVDDASGVTADSQEVRFKGIPAGTITDVEIENGGPVLTVSVLEEFGPIYRDARATLRPNTALEDMFLDIVDRGTKRAGEATAAEPLRARQTGTSVQVEEILQVFDSQTRTRMGALLRDLGGGLEGRGDDLRESFVKVVPFLQVAARLSEELSERSAKTRKLVSDFSALSGELARRDRELRDLIGEGGRLLRSVADSSGALDATLRELPPALSELDSSFAAVEGALPDVDQALRSLRPVADRLPEGLSALRRLSDTAEPAVRALRQPVRRLEALAQAASPFSSNLARALRSIRPQTGAFNHITRSTAACAYPEIHAFFAWQTSLAKFEDARGVFPRADITVGLGSNPGPLSDPNNVPVEGCAPGLPLGGTP